MENDEPDPLDANIAQFAITHALIGALYESGNLPAHNLLHHMNMMGKTLENGNPSAHELFSTYQQEIAALLQSLDKIRMKSQTPS